MKISSGRTLTNYWTIYVNWCRTADSVSAFINTRSEERYSAHTDTHSLVIIDDFEDSLFDVLTQTRPVNHVSGTSRSLQLPTDQQADILAAMRHQQLFSLCLTHNNNNNNNFHLPTNFKYTIDNTQNAGSILGLHSHHIQHMAGRTCWLFVYTMQSRIVHLPSCLHAKTFKAFKRLIFFLFTSIKWLQDQQKTTCFCSISRRFLSRSYCTRLLAW